MLENSKDTDWWQAEQQDDEAEGTQITAAFLIRKRARVREVDNVSLTLDQSMNLSLRLMIYDIRYNKVIYIQIYFARN